MAHSTTPAQYILILIDLAENQGCARPQLLQGTSLAGDGMAQIGARVADEDFDRLVENALALTGNPALGLELGMRINLSAHAILGQAFMTCRDLGQVMELFLRYYHLLASALQLEFGADGEQCTLTVLSRPAEGEPEFGYELFISAFLNTLRGLLNQPELELHIDVPYPQPKHHQAYRSLFGEQVRFEQLQGRIAFHRDLLHTPLPSSNSALRELYEGECARLLADLEGEDSVAEQTLRLLRKLEGQYPQMPQLAQMLNFSPRTYRRRLEQAGSSYQELLDQVRAEHATRYLRNTRLPLSSIAYMVGFNDASNFRRAYRKWTGLSPREVRHGQGT